MRILIRSGSNKKWKLAKPVKLEAESRLQKLLIESPQLIDISEIREGVPPLDFAIEEFSITGSGSLDIIGFTHEGDIALIECKLDKNPEVKRKVVGQILEYAAYLWQMSYDDFDYQIQKLKGKSLANLMEEHVHAKEWDEENFRKRITESLENGSFILIIVVDEINDELKRIIKFLNECSESTSFSLHALEMSQFQPDEDENTSKTEILVPNLYGLSAKPPSGGPRREWTEKEFFEEVDRSVPDEKTRQTIRNIFEFSNSGIGKVGFGTGGKIGTFSLSLKHKGSWEKIFFISYDRQFTWFAFDTLIAHGVDEELVSHYMRELNSLGFRFGEKNKAPAFDIELLNNKEKLEEFKKHCIELKNALLSK